MYIFFKTPLVAVIFLLAACHDPSLEINEEADGWNWSVDKVKEQETIVLLEDNLHTSRYEKALEHFQWLIDENPQIHPSVYDNGLAIYEGLIQESNDQSVQLKLEIERRKVENMKRRYFPE